jgi:hypothetical protein
MGQAIGLAFIVPLALRGLSALNLALDAMVGLGVVNLIALASYRETVRRCAKSEQQPEQVSRGNGLRS